jgi:hypothetical protein
MIQNQRCYLLLIILCATTVRVVYFFQFQDNPFFDYVPRSWDQGIYYEGGLAFARGDWLAVAPKLDNHFSPIYQYFLGILFLLFGNSIEVAWVSQFLLGIFSTLLVYSIACKFFSRTAGLIAALLFTFYAPTWLYEGTFYRASLIIFLELATFRLLLAAGNHPNYFRLISSALILGLFMQVRSNNLLIFPLALCYMWLRMDTLGKSKWPLLGGYILVVAMVCAPALLWVKEVRGQWGLYDKSGPENLLLSNTLDHSVRTYEHNETYREFLKSVPLETGPISEYILKTFLNHPLEFLVLYLKKTYYYFNNYEIPVTVNFYLSQEFSPILGLGVPFACIGVMGISGALLMWKRKGWTLLHSFFFAAFMIFLPFLVLSRYRLYSVPFLCMFSGYFLVVVQGWLAEKNWKTTSFSFLSVVLLSLLLKTDPLPEGEIRIDDFANMGAAYLNNEPLGDDSLSFTFYQRAHYLSDSLEPSLQQSEKIRRLFHDFHLYQAKSFLESDKRKKTLDSLERALAFDYSVSNTHFIYAKELFKMGLLEGALREALEALILNTNSKETHLLLGQIYSELSYSPYWITFHWKQALEQLKGSERENLSKIIIQIQNQLGLPGLKNSKTILNKKSQAIDTLNKGLPPLANFPLNYNIPFDLEKGSPRRILHYTIMLYQRLILSPQTSRADIHLQLGILFWKKENRLSATVYHLERAWELGLQYPSLSKLKKLRKTNLNFEEP